MLFKIIFLLFFPFIILLFSCEQIPRETQKIPTGLTEANGPPIESFSFTAIDDQCFIDNYRGILILPEGTDRSDLYAEIVLTNPGNIEPDDGNHNNFTGNPKLYRILQDDGSQRYWRLYIVEIDSSDSVSENQLHTQYLYYQGHDYYGNIDNDQNKITLTLPYSSSVESSTSYHFSSPGSYTFPDNGGKVNPDGGEITVIGKNGLTRTYQLVLQFLNNDDAEVTTSEGIVEYYVDSKINKIFDIASTLSKEDFLNSLNVPFGAEVQLFQSDLSTPSQELENGQILQSVSEDGNEIINYFIFLDNYTTPIETFSGIDSDIGNYNLSVSATGNFGYLKIAPEIYQHWIKDSLNYLDFTVITKILYQYYNDSFDFIIINALETPFYTGQKYMGLTYNVKNDVSGINYGNIDNTSQYGSLGSLLCVIFFPDYNGLYISPSFHEIAHHWAGHWDILNNVSGHWEFSSGGGQLGGWSYGSLENLENGKYRAHYKNYNSFAMGNLQGNYHGFSQWELYAMGLIGADEVTEELEIARNPSWEDKDQGLFSADSIDRYSIEDIVQLYGPREPEITLSQKEFRGLYVIISSDPMDKALLQRLEMRLIRFSSERNMEPGHVMSFYQATGGRATLDFLDSADYLK